MIWPLKWIFESAGLCMFAVGEVMTATGMILAVREDGIDRRQTRDAITIREARVR